MGIKLIVVDDDMLIRESLKIILSFDEEIEVVETFEGGQDATEYCLNNSVDIALLDVRMPKGNGVIATKQIVNKTSTKVIILTTFDEDEYIREALNNGAKGYLLKNTLPDEIIETIKMVYGGGNCVIQQEVINKITGILPSNNTSKIDKSLFTQREINVMEGIAEGLTNKQISKKLFIAEGTVKNHITSILGKTNLSHRTQIAIYYIKGKIN